MVGAFKICYICKLRLSTDKFCKNKNSKDGFSFKCRSCSKNYDKQYYEKNKETLLYKAKERIHKKRNEINAYQKSWRAANPDSWKRSQKTWAGNNPNKIKEASLKSKFNINLLQYISMFDAQNGECAICGTHRSKFKKDLAVDHCHVTGKIRGLLCGTCNVGLGAFKDNKNLLIKATIYLNSSEKI